MDTLRYSRLPSQYLLRACKDLTLVLFPFFLSFPVWLVTHGCRIIEIEWAVKNDTEFVPSPKPARKRKAKQRSKSTLRHETVFGEDAAASAVDGAASPGKIRRQLYETEFGTEVTNTESPNASSKRPFRDAVEELDSMSARTPVKRQKRPGPGTPSAGMMVDREAESQDDGVDVVAAAATMRRKVVL